VLCPQLQGLLYTKGPQAEGWHGQPYSRPLSRTREYVSILRAIFQRQEPLSYLGEHYQIPYAGVDKTGLGKPLKSILHSRPDIPIYLAAIGQKNVELAAEIADGWLPIFFSPRHFENIFLPALEAGFTKAGAEKWYSGFDIAPSVPVMVGANLEACRNSIKPLLALYIGGMGAMKQNFYFNLACRYGYDAEAIRIQDLYLQGKKIEAINNVPDDLVDDVALCGPPERIRERLEIWKAIPITTLNLIAYDLTSLRTVAELV